ncbi:DMT family transporter [Oceanidesulfovibrio indonesiensis]|nr:DMT family transporter [Oceanidesulfovibrio indonesiensis]
MPHAGPHGTTPHKRIMSTPQRPATTAASPETQATEESAPFLVYAKLVGSVTLWGGTWIAGRYLAQHITPFPAAFIRFAIASIFLLWLTKRVEGRLPGLNRTNWLQLALLGLTGVFAYNAFFFTGLQTTTAGRAALIVAAIPAVLSVYSAIVLKEPFPPRKIAGVLLSFLGVALIVSDGNPAALFDQGLSRGDLAIFGCVASWSVYTLAGRRAMTRFSPHTSVTWSCVLGSLFLLIPALANDLPQVTFHAGWLDWLCFIYLGVFATGMAFSWYYEGVKAVGPSRAGVFINLVPVTAVVLGFLILGEPLSHSLLAGGGMVMAGVWLTNRPVKKRNC